MPFPAYMYFYPCSQTNKITAHATITQCAGRENGCPKRTGHPNKTARCLSIFSLCHIDLSHHTTDTLVMCVGWNLNSYLDDPDTSASDEATYVDLPVIGDFPRTVYETFAQNSPQPKFTPTGGYRCFDGNSISAEFYACWVHKEQM